MHQRLLDGRGPRVPVKLRNIELEILDTCYGMLAGSCVTVSDYLQCLRIQEQLQKLPDNVCEIKMRKQDLENIMLGFKLTAGHRPESWTRARSLFESINAPLEVEEEEVKPEEPKPEVEGV